MLGLEYQATGIAVTRAMIKSNPDLIRSIMKAYAEAIHYYKTHPKEAIAILQKYLKTDDMEALKETYEAIGLTLIPEKPYPTLRGVQMMLSEIGAKDPKAQAAKPEQFVDLSFVKELDGFIDGLYKARPAVASGEGAKPAPATAKEKIAAAKPAPAAPSTTKEKVATAKPAAPAPEKAKASAEAKTAPAQSSKGEEYTVVGGDTLSRLAGKYYGDVLKWPKIYEANKQTVKNPHYIYIGQKLIIPGDA
jgi:LysM repeat protein